MSFKIGKIEIGLNKQPVVIAEIGINHGGSLKVAKEMVDSAQRAGIEVVKHQTHIVEDEMSISAKETIPGNSTESIYDIMKNYSLHIDEEIELKNYVELKGMEYIDIDKEEFHKTLDSFRSPHLWGKDELGNWRLRHNVNETGLND